ncbi:hypothetical protein JH06_1124 [Blastocystis sp. subtype 4]|uniref:hypothetical protein n=1 Tax=Blastocystis sp. subtype 4 TaxID=944170 RepID=UPI000711B001|nr:hypothetical protein JH06_1124 [Blastocystis sp. subtype 4]KNB45819.1 hypothetical protein JH06_1124 [Blastocystis sp. subtype 4]|eukprot:XP_014529262.1 hypothetical protein JH06_1124 [Blastocystis sp. subtype 4]
MSDTKDIRVPKSEFESYQKGKAEYDSIMQKISDMEMSISENKDVLETLEGMEDSRRCFRVVDSILVERNVGEVKKALQTEKENMMVLMGQLNTRSRDLEKAILSFETKYGITKAVAV